MGLKNRPQNISLPKLTSIAYVTRSLFLVVFVFLSFSLSLKGNSGDLDLTFGVKGTVRTTVPGGGGFVSGANGMALQDEGKIVLTGYEKFGAVYKFVTARFNADGSLDMSSGAGGFVIIEFGSSFIGNRFPFLPTGVSYTVNIAAKGASFWRLHRALIFRMS